MVDRNFRLSLGSRHLTTEKHRCVYIQRFHSLDVYLALSELPSQARRFRATAMSIEGIVDSCGGPLIREEISIR